jgi:RimJ/RimL family protein N-acetyltransferase
MSVAIETTVPPDLPQVRDWLARLRLQKGLSHARDALRMLYQRYPDHAAVRELADWHDPQWWQALEFGSVRMERRSPEHFDFVWSLVLDRDFSSKLKHIPEDLTPRDLLQALTQDQISLLPDSRSIQWVIFKGAQPVGLSMFVNINFRNRSAEQIMGVLSPHDHSFLVGDAYCASLLFAFNSLGLNKVQGLIYARNRTVAEQQERLGFRREGLLRQAVWNEEQQCYEDLIQIALLREDFQSNRVLQRHIRRQPHLALLDQRRDWPRFPMAPTPG